jgi:uncharacterized membrane protein (DUF4010 family)
MNNLDLTHTFFQFGLAWLVGFLIGLEREKSSTEKEIMGLRDFVLIALLGALAAFLTRLAESPIFLGAGFLGLIAVLLSEYWAGKADDPGVTTEIAALITFLLGVLVIYDHFEVAIALAIVTVGILYQKRAIEAFGARVEGHELRAALKLLVITFIVLPILPHQSLDNFLTARSGVVVVVVSAERLELDVDRGQALVAGQEVEIYGPHREPLGPALVEQRSGGKAQARLKGPELFEVPVGAEVRLRLGGEAVHTMLSALRPYKLWLLVVLVSLISFVGYILIRWRGGTLGLGLTGLIGGLVSSTVTTLSFARRSVETPALNRNFAGAVLLAGSIMFPRLLGEIAVVNQELAKAAAWPLLACAGVGLMMAIYHLHRSHQETSHLASASFDNPFSLQAALHFMAVFAAILMITRLATVYLGGHWLPLISVVSGLTDADAIAFSLSDAEQSGAISLPWAAFNLVLAALANTVMKVFLVLGIGDRGLFRYLVGAVALMATAGLATAWAMGGIAPLGGP